MSHLRSLNIGSRFLTDFDKYAGGQCACRAQNNEESNPHKKWVELSEDEWNFLKQGRHTQEVTSKLVQLRNVIQRRCDTIVRHFDQVLTIQPVFVNLENKLKECKVKDINLQALADSQICSTFAYLMELSGIIMEFYNFRELKGTHELAQKLIYGCKKLGVSSVVDEALSYALNIRQQMVMHHPEMFSRQSFTERRPVLTVRQRHLRNEIARSSNVDNQSEHGGWDLSMRQNPDLQLQVGLKHVVPSKEDPLRFAKMRS